MTKVDAIKYALAYKVSYAGDERPIDLYEKNGEYLAGKTNEHEYALSCGWRYVGSIPVIAREMNLI